MEEKRKYYMRKQEKLILSIEANTKQDHQIGRIVGQSTVAMSFPYIVWLHDVSVITYACISTSRIVIEPFDVHFLCGWWFEMLTLLHRERISHHKFASFRSGSVGVCRWCWLSTTEPEETNVTQEKENIEDDEAVHRHPFISPPIAVKNLKKPMPARRTQASSVQTQVKSFLNCLAIRWQTMRVNNLIIIRRIIYHIIFIKNTFSQNKYIGQVYDSHYVSRKLAFLGLLKTVSE